MSVQAMAWALSRRDLGKDSSARHVLLCLANYAGTDGRGAFPSARTLTDDTGLSERTVRVKLDLLEARGLIERGNQALAAVYIDRQDRRPVVYDLMLKRGAEDAPREEATGCNVQYNGVQPTTERGAVTAPNPSLNHQVTEQQQLREFADLVDEQDQDALQALEQPSDGRQRIAMHAEWQQDDAMIEAQLRIIGAGGLEVVSDETLGSFKGFYLAKSDIRETAAGWCYRLAKWVKQEQVATAGRGFEAAEPSADWAAKGVRL